MTDLAIPASHTVVERREPAPTDLTTWVQEARQAELIATNLANTSFVPTTLRGKPAEIAAAILAGLELGLKPMATLRSMDVIQGTPALRAHAMRGLVQSHGHTIELLESTPERCVMRGRRKDSPTWQTVVWTTQRAGQLGLLSKDQWKKQPQTMLIARATGEVCRLVAADALFAMPYAAEELRESNGDDASTPVDEPVVTVAEILRGTAAEDAMTAPLAPDDPWSTVQYPEPVSIDELNAPTDSAPWPPVRQPGGAE